MIPITFKIAFEIEIAIVKKKKDLVNGLINFFNEFKLILS